MSGSVREAVPVVRELLAGPPKSSGDPPGCPGVVGRPSWLSLRGGRPFRMSGSWREALLGIRVKSGGSPGCLRVVGRRSRMSRCGLEILPNVQKALLDIQEWSIGPPRCPGVVGRPS